MREIHPPFRETGPVSDQRDADCRETDDDIPEGYTAEKWAAMKRVANTLGAQMEGLGFAFGPRNIEGMRDGKSYVYFVGGDVGCIKIGYSIAPHERLAQMQVGSPIKLRLLAKRVGDLEDEKEYHHRFRASRSHGEWFHRTPELLAEIEWLNEPDDTPLSPPLSPMSGEGW